MLRKSRKAEKSTGLHDTSKPRPDINLKDNEFIAAIDRPAFGGRRQWALDGFARGLPLESLLQGSGFTPKQLFEILGLDAVAEHKHYERLTEIHEKRNKP